MPVPCGQEKLEKMDFTKFPKLDKKKMDNLEASALTPSTLGSLVAESRRP